MTADGFIKKWRESINYLGKPSVGIHVGWDLIPSDSKVEQLSGKDAWNKIYSFIPSWFKNPKTFKQLVDSKDSDYQQIVKDDTNIDKYNIDAVISFMRTILADLGETYRKSNLAQLKVLLGLTFPNGITWSYNDRLDPEISPLYKAIRDFDKHIIPSGAG